MPPPKLDPSFPMEIICVPESSLGKLVQSKPKVDKKIEMPEMLIRVGNPQPYSEKPSGVMYDADKEDCEFICTMNQGMAQQGSKYPPLPIGHLEIIIATIEQTQARGQAKFVQFSEVKAVLESKWPEIEKVYHKPVYNWWRQRRQARLKLGMPTGKALLPSFEVPPDERDPFLPFHRRPLEYKSGAQGMSYSSRPEGAATLSELEQQRRGLGMGADLIQLIGAREHLKRSACLAEVSRMMKVASIVAPKPAPDRAEGAEHPCYREFGCHATQVLGGGDPEAHTLSSLSSLADLADWAQRHNFPLDLSEIQTRPSPDLLPKSLHSRLHTMLPSHHLVPVLNPLSPGGMNIKFMDPQQMRRQHARQRRSEWGRVGGVLADLEERARAAGWWMNNTHPSMAVRPGGCADGPPRKKQCRAQDDIRLTGPRTWSSKQQEAGQPQPLPPDAPRKQQQPTPTDREQWWMAMKHALSGARAGADG